MSAVTRAGIEGVLRGFNASLGLPVARITSRVYPDTAGFPAATLRQAISQGRQHASNVGEIGCTKCVRCVAPKMPPKRNVLEKGKRKTEVRRAPPAWL